MIKPPTNNEIPPTKNRKLTPRERWRLGPNALNEWGVPYWIEEAVTSSAGQARSLNAAQHLWAFVFDHGERSQLGGTLGTALERRNVIEMWRHVRSGTALQAIVDINVACGWMLPEVAKRLLGEDDPPAMKMRKPPLRAAADFAVDRDEAAFQQAVTTSALVIDQRARTVYWKGAQLEVDWHGQNRSWSFLCDLAQAAKRGHGIVLSDRDGTLKPSAIRAAKCRLVNLPGVPRDLAQLIVSKPQKYYHLNVPPEKIVIFEGVELRFESL